MLGSSFPSLLEMLGSSTTLLTVKLVQPMIKPTVAMWHESMEILAKERIRGMNIGLLVGQTLLLPLPSGLRIAALMDRCCPNPPIGGGDFRQTPAGPRP
jgi:hypothetical protein